jgi:DNA topoisomerase-2
MPKKATYKSLDQREHILSRQDMYIGSVKNTETEFYAAIEKKSDNEKNEKTISIVKKSGTINPGLHRIFIEILSNAIDNVWRSSSTETPTTKIKVDITPEGQITIWNDGLTIPVQIDPESGLYNPELVFGRLLTSSNYDDDEERMTSGRNGIGAKATAVFSKEFNVKLFDIDSGHQYVQTWRNNMADKDKHKITSPKTKNSYTQITFTPDYPRFGVDGLSEDMQQLFYKNIIDTAMITGVAVYYNDEKVPVKSLKDYAMLYEESDLISFSTSDCDVVLSANNKSDGSFAPVSFVNGIETFQGGIHVDAWSDALLRPVLEKINAGVKKGASPLLMKDIRPYFRLFLNCKLVNPAFTSQEKSKLVSPAVTKPEVLQKHINAVMKWPVIESIKDILKSRELLVLKKTEKKKGFVKIDGLDPANLAGTKEFDKCSLILCEGDSAKTFAVKGIQTGVYGRMGRDYFGIYPLRGKCLNVRNSTPAVISKNKEICDLIQALNLKYGSDYTDNSVYESLSYGRVIILTDSDVDGYHICGLLLNFFHKLFPSLIERNPSFITCMRTPIVRIYSGKTEHQFYTLEEFKKYTTQHPNYKGDVKYFKGLGTNSNKEIETAFGKKMIEFVNDERTDSTMDKVFHTKFSDQRKQWLEQYDPSNEVDVVGKGQIQMLPVSDFLDNEMIKFSIDDCKRSIPSLMDGLKESHRKILYATFLKNLRYTGKTMKVAQLAGFVAEKTNYHHGEQCLFETITKLAHDFVGSNNIPLLYRDGQFGSRIQGGKDAANARYIFTKVDVLTRLLFRQEDDVLLPRVMDDGDAVEPVQYVPILPMALVNGSIGIGSGWSSQIPCYNPLDLVKCVETWLDARSVHDDDDMNDMKVEWPEIHPWYRGFNGVIEKVNDTKYITKGILTKKKTGRSTNTTCVVTELPISVWTDKFKESVEELVENKDVKAYRNYSTDVDISFELDEHKDGLSCTIENLKLFSYLNTSNMVLFSPKGTIKKYNTVYDILEEFCHVRYEYYIKRKEHQLSEIEYELTIANNKMRFLKEVMSGELVVQEVDEKVLAEEMKTRGYYANEKKKEEDEEDDKKNSLSVYGYLVNMNIRSFTKQKVETLQTEIARLEALQKKIKKTTPSAMWKADLSEFMKAYEKLY